MSQIHPFSSAAPPPRQTADLSDPQTRARLTPSALKAYRRLSHAWRLTNLQAARLLDVSERHWGRLKAEDPTTTLGQDALTRMSALVGIYKGLHLLFSEPLSDEWPSLPNNGIPFNGVSPIDIMIRGGIPAMLETRGHVDALRGGL